MTTILDPTSEERPIARRLSPIAAGQIRSIALVDISKPRGEVLLDRLAEGLQRRFPNLQIGRYRKPAFSKPAPADLREEIARTHQFVILALAD